MTQKEYIEERMEFFAQNIDEFEIGEEILDKDKSECKVMDKTSNSIEVWIGRKTKEGEDGKQWFDMRSFNKRFKKIEV